MHGKVISASQAPLWWSTVHSTVPSLSSPLLRLLLAILCTPAAESSADPSALHEGLEEEGVHSLMLQSVVLHHFQQRTKRERRADTSEEHADHLVSEEE